MSVLFCLNQNDISHYHIFASSVFILNSTDKLLRWQIILNIRTTDADKCSVRLPQPFVFAYALYALFACGCVSRCFVAVFNNCTPHRMFSPLPTLLVLIGQFVSRVSYGAQRRVVEGSD